MLHFNFLKSHFFYAIFRKSTVNCSSVAQRAIASTKRNCRHKIYQIYIVSLFIWFMSAQKQNTSFSNSAVWADNTQEFFAVAFIWPISKAHFVCNCWHIISKHRLHGSTTFSKWLESNSFKISIQNSETECAPNHLYKRINTQERNSI